MNQTADVDNEGGQRRKPISLSGFTLDLNEVLILRAVWQPKMPADKCFYALVSAGFLRTQAYKLVLSFLGLDGEMDRSRVQTGLSSIATDEDIPTIALEDLDDHPCNHIITYTQPRPPKIPHPTEASPTTPLPVSLERAGARQPTLDTGSGVIDGFPYL